MASEPTPTYQSFSVDEADQEVMRMYTTVKNIKLREFFAAAYKQMSEERNRWSAKTDMDRYPWLGNPVGLKRFSAVVDEAEVAGLHRWADKDGVKKSDVYYTAVYHHVRRARAELKKMGIPLEQTKYEDDDV